MLAAQGAESDPPLGLPKTASPSKTNQSPLPPVDPPQEKSVVRPRAQKVDRTASVQPTAYPSTYHSPPLNPPSVSLSPPSSHRAPELTKMLTTQAGSPKDMDKLRGRPGVVTSESRYRLDDGKGKGTPEEEGQKNAPEIRTTLPQTPGRAAPSSVRSSPQVDRTASVQPTTSSFTYPPPPLNRSNVSILPPPSHAAPALTNTFTTRAGRPNDKNNVDGRLGVVSSELRYRLDDGKGMGTLDEDGRKNAPETRTILPQTLGRTAPSLVHSSLPQPLTVFERPRLDRSHSHMQVQGNVETVDETMRAAGKQASEKGRGMPSTFKKPETDPELGPEDSGTNPDGAQRRTGHALDNTRHPKIAPESPAGQASLLGLRSGYGSSAPRPPDPYKSQRYVSGSPSPLSPPLTGTETLIMSLPEAMFRFHFETHSA